MAVIGRFGFLFEKGEDDGAGGGAEIFDGEIGGERGQGGDLRQREEIVPVVLHDEMRFGHGFPHDRLPVADPGV